ncbi:carboxylesterase/lipase family protein [Aminobacter sp. MET-1]|uniref:carboxylesterase/lipase family protein n=1 Tax=Aminobacter sp. MET-1 TaxID=2951085 RepID=UPI002269DC17|nr:carboxylesterase family protein [Aminobacter sp. MET-1]MCX8571738.1 carboxylesterase family protein [Aminobacter sp. MET-1]
MDSVAETSGGRIAGMSRDGVGRFLGIPYAAAPVGELRLRSPRPHPGWRGIRAADRIGAAPPQLLSDSQTWLNEPIQRMDEDCLTLNVWAPENARRAPVMVWFHGGATRNGHGGAAACNGSRLAREHDIVVVTANYRLGPLGGLAHPDLTDPETGLNANWGMQDKIAALRWVRDNIEAFGGDPARVTMAGQSSGAANAVLMAQNPACRCLFRGVIAQSPPLFRPPMFVGLEEAAEYTEAVAAALGTDAGGLRALDGMDIVKREAALLRDGGFAGRFPRPRTAPTLDGQLVLAWPHDGQPADVPLLTGFTRDEAKFWYDLALPDGTSLSPLAPPADEAALGAAIARLLPLHYAFEDALSPEMVDEAYREAMPGTDATVRWLAIYGDLVFRAPILRLAQRHAGCGQPAFLYDLAWPLAKTGGTPHAACVPFVFGMHGHPHLSGKIGAGAEADALSTAMMAAWAAFVSDGTPSAHLHDWRPLDPEAAEATVMTFGEQRRVSRFGALEGGARLGLWKEIAA